MSNSNSNSALDSLLDMSLDDIADLPEFIVLPAGAYRCTLTLSQKTMGTHPAVEASLVVLEVVEMASPASEEPKVGTESSSAYMLDNEYGLGNLKKLLKPLAVHTGLTKVSEIMVETKGIEVLVVTKQSQSKDKTKTYLDIVSIQVM